MLRGNEKRSIFLDDEDRSRFLDVMRIKEVENEFELYAYCLMDNHVHLLINEKGSSIARIMKCINVSYVIYFNRKYNRVGHLFQNRFRSEVINQDSYLLSAARYIHNNPVHAGITDSPGKYKWSSYESYSEGRNVSGLIDANFLLEMYSMYPDRAVEEFIRYTTALCHEEFIDICEPDVKEIMTTPEALKYADKLLIENGLSLQEIQQQKGRVKGTFKHELVVRLKHATNLSCRDIGDLLGLNKSTVQELE